MFVTNSPTEASIKQLDRRYPHETHKIGVLYVGPGQANNEAEILANPFGSLRYTDFLFGLGDLICLRDVDQRTTFVGGLKAEDGDGDYAYMWEDDVMQVCCLLLICLLLFSKYQPWFYFVAVFFLFESDLILGDFSRGNVNAES